MQYLGIDWGTRKAAWCAVDERGELVEGMIPADVDGLASLVHRLGPDVRGCVEMMSGAVWVREQLRACGWEFQIADARKVKAIAPLACRPTASTRACSLSWPVGISCPSCGCRHLAIASCGNGCGAALIWCG
jgi:hypothetical protein